MTNLQRRRRIRSNWQRKTLMAEDAAESGQGNPALLIFREKKNMHPVEYDELSELECALISKLCVIKAMAASKDFYFRAAEVAVDLEKQFGKRSKPAKLFRQLFRHLNTIEKFSSLPDHLLLEWSEKLGQRTLLEDSLDNQTRPVSKETS